ncbi:MAG TPA: phosphopantetheine-binding protein [Terriglobales bacterium]|nr:phosphopantetheine-binding protein [Terriglobales bacterium]
MPRSSEALNAKLLNLIAEEMAIEEAELTPSASLSEDLGLDEIDVAELLMQAEEKLGAQEFSEDEWEDCRTVGDYIRLVTQHLGKRGKKK